MQRSQRIRLWIWKCQKLAHFPVPACQICAKS